MKKPPVSDGAPQEAIKPDVVTVAIARAQGELQERGSRGNAHARAVSDLLGAVLASFYVPPEVDTARYPDIVDALHSATRTVQSAVDGKKQRGAPPVYIDVSRAVRDGIVQAQDVRLRSAAREKRRALPPTSHELALMVEVFSRASGADAVFPRRGTSEERVEKYVKAIDWAKLGLPEGEELDAEGVVIACAGATGFERPSRLFDADKKSKKPAAE